MYKSRACCLVGTKSVSIDSDLKQSTYCIQQRVFYEWTWEAISARLSPLRLIEASQCIDYYVFNECSFAVLELIRDCMELVLAAWSRRAQLYTIPRQDTTLTFFCSSRYMSFVKNAVLQCHACGQTTCLRRPTLCRRHTQLVHRIGKFEISKRYFYCFLAELYDVNVCIARLNPIRSRRLSTKMNVCSMRF